MSHNEIEILQMCEAIEAVPRKKLSWTPFRPMRKEEAEPIEESAGKHAIGIIGITGAAERTIYRKSSCHARHVTFGTLHLEQSQRLRIE